MFYSCSSLERFDCETPELNYGYFMFYGCTSLRFFRGDLSKLDYAQYMFGNSGDNCTCFNLQSLKNIAETIADWSNGGGSYSHEIHIGLENGLQYDNGDGVYQKKEEYLQQIRDKGWTVYEIYNYYN